MIPIINMLWVGDRLGYIEQLSMLSFVAAGHPVRLFTYGEVDGVPAGVEIADASAIVPFETTQNLRHKQTGSFALASDYFRFRLQQLEAGIWADADVVCLRPLSLRSPFLLGWESDDYVNGAILYLGPESQLLADALASFSPGNIPAWVPWHKALPFQLGRRLGRSFGPADLPRGSFGPKAITALVKQYSLVEHVLPPSVLYPLHPRRALEVFAPSSSLDAYVTEDSLTIHLWNEKLGDLKRTRPPGTSAIGRLLASYGV